MRQIEYVRIGNLLAEKDMADCVFACDSSRCYCQIQKKHNDPNKGISSLYIEGVYNKSNSFAGLKTFWTDLMLKALHQDKIGVNFVTVIYGHKKINSN